MGITGPWDITAEETEMMDAALTFHLKEVQ